MPLSPAERRLRASKAGLTGWANTKDRRARALRGQAGLMAKFERQARDENPGLTNAEIHRRAETLYKLHFADMCFKASKARREKREALENQAAAMKAERDRKARNLPAKSTHRIRKRRSGIRGAA